GVKEGEETEEGGESDAEQPSPFIPPNRHSNTPTPPDGGAVPSDYDAVVEELAAQGNCGVICRVEVSEIVAPPIATGPDNCIYDIDPGRRQRLLAKRIWPAQIALLIWRRASNKNTKRLSRPSSAAANTPLPPGSF